jgi:hypothetical protein
MRSGRVAATLVLVAGLALVCAGPAAAGDFAPVDRPGPALSVPAAQLAAAFTCKGDLAGAAATPVLLVPGTTLTPQSNFSWNYERAFDARGIPRCTIELPQAATGDIQIAGEYVASATRQMHDRAGRRISMLGFSQGGMVPRWAFRFWPDTA